MSEQLISLPDSVVFVLRVLWPIRLSVSNFLQRRANQHLMKSVDALAGYSLPEIDAGSWIVSYCESHHDLFCAYMAWVRLLRGVWRRE